MGYTQDVVGGPFLLDWVRSYKGLALLVKRFCSSVSG